MSFGQSYEEVELQRIAKPGVYHVEIMAVEENTVKGWNVLDIKIRYCDNVADVPDLIRFFDVNENSTPEQKRAFNIRLTQFRKAFKLGKDLSVQGRLLWLGKKGYIGVGIDNNGFTSIQRYISEEDFETNQ